ncbi:transposase [Chryseobacterium pennae]|uniref:transposase n=1 Tax=Chryseobacterium pennae TaxID=2258962 RepID=UPI001E635AA3|nr:transposase [Chryseobacterium pennae]
MSPHLSRGKRAFTTKFDLTQVMCLIIKRLKTGCQWRELRLKEYFGREKISWQSINYCFNKWSKGGSFRRIWIHLLYSNKRALDLSSLQLDGSYTRSRMGGEGLVI